MERKERVKQVYGYAVCLVAIITFLIALTGVLNSIIDASSPLYTFGYDNELSSYQNYKMHVLKSENVESNYVPDDATIQQMYEDAKTYKINKVRHQTTKNGVVNSVLIVLCVFLFICHWRWLKKLDKSNS